MALKPTIHKFRISLSDTNRDVYDAEQITIAQHPSEPVDRMMARVLALCFHWQPELALTKGLSTTEEPDLWIKSLDQQIQLWVDIGEPSLDRIKKACRVADRVDVFTFNSKSEVWWDQVKNKVHQYDANIYRFGHSGIEALSQVVERSMNLSVMISDESVYVDSEKGSFEVSLESLHSHV